MAYWSFGEAILQLKIILVVCSLSVERTFDNYIQVSSFNCRNIKTSLPEVKRLCDSSDLLLLQETWLANDELHLLNTLDERFYGQGVSAMDTESQVLRGRPHGGLAVLWKKTLGDCRIVNMQNSRIMCLEMKVDGRDMTVYNIYMPCDSRDNFDEYLHTLSHINTAVESDVPYIMMMGDFNANTRPGSASLFGQELKRFSGEEQLVISDLSMCDPATFTFYSEAHQSVSWLDHCLSNINLHSVIKHIAVKYDYVTSDHLPVCVSLDLDKAQTTTLEIDAGSRAPTVRWQSMSKEDLARYLGITEAELSSVKLHHELLLCDNPNCDSTSHTQAIDSMYCSIVNALKASSEAFVKDNSTQKKQPIIPSWNEYCREAHSDARNAFLEWVYNGRPRSGYLLRNMQQTRCTFKQALRRCRALTSRTDADKLARRFLTKDSKKFWSEIKRLKGKTSAPIATTIGTATGHTNIAELWRSHYCGLLNSTPPSSISQQIKNTISKCEDTEIVSAQEVAVAVKDLKLGKSCGLDSLAAEHFRYASEKLHILLSLCFTCMLRHSYVPKCFSNTVIVPVIKDKKGNVTDVDNYRPIAITSIASKILEKILLVRVQDYLYTSDNQFSFKSKHSTDLCIFTLKSIIDYYVQASSPVYICYLDASKAFDRVNYWKLFDKLISRNTPYMFIRFMMTWYCTQEFMVKWGNTFSTPFTAANGVRQGGILSPLFFNVYLDNLSTVLNLSHVGCMMNEKLFNHLMYADDMVLVTPSASALQYLLNVCKQYAHDHDIVYNVKKTVSMCIRPQKQKYELKLNVQLSGNPLRYVDSHKYLGVYINSKFKDDVNIRAQVQNIYSRGNAIIRNFSHCTENIKCLLFNSYCSNIYCAPLWSRYTCESFRQITVAYNRIFRVLFGLKHRISVSSALIHRGLNPFIVLCRKNIVSFRSRLLSSKNTLIKTIVDSLYFLQCTQFIKWSQTIFCV